MSENEVPKVGVYICHCGKNIADVININELKKYVEKLPNVAIVRDYKFMCSKTGQDLISTDLQAGSVNRIVVAACSPLMHELTFRSVLTENNVNPFFFEQANIREHISWVSMDDPEGALELAKDHVKMAVAKVSQDNALTRQKFPVIQEALVVGGGVTGMFAALDLAKSVKVHLVERSPTIGGHMAQLDKTFPTMDCSACIITPKMVEVGRNPNIDLLTYAEIESTEMNVGNFHVKVRQKARRIDHSICTGCGSCSKVCPVTAPNEWDMNLSHRSAAYIPFPQAVPGKYTIDANACIECGSCLEACEVGAIDLNQQDEIIDLNVGAIILATGNNIYDPSKLWRYGYAKFKNVLTGIELERMLSSSGPTLGHVIRPSDKQTPERVAFLQCVGSRDAHPGAHHYCSRVCCMYAIKQARQFKEKHPNSEVYIIYIDIRSFGKGYEEFYEISCRQYGIYFIRGRIGDVLEEPDKSLILRGTDTLVDELFELKVDMLVLATALESRQDASNISRLFGIQCAEDGMFMEAHPKLRPVDSLSDGIFIAGTCQAPRDIPDSVAQAKAAAGSASNFIAAGEIEVEPYYAYVRSEYCSGCKACVKICPFDAITFNGDNGVSEINSAKCKGCGACMVTCPSNAIVQNHFTSEELLAEINGLTPWQNYIKE